LCEHQNEPGIIKATKSDLQIFTKDGFINVLEIQAPGKKKMDCRSFLNGFALSDEYKAS
jgi:methionyl-tRNA formyltransferase